MSLLFIQVDITYYWHIFPGPGEKAAFLMCPLWWPLVWWWWLRPPCPWGGRARPPRQAPPRSRQPETSAFHLQPSFSIKYPSNFCFMLHPSTNFSSFLSCHLRFNQTFSSSMVAGSNFAGRSLTLCTY